MFSRQQKLIGVLFLAVFFAGGFFFGLNQNVKIQKEISLLHMDSTVVQADFQPFWKAWATLDEKYPGAVETTDQERIYGAIKGLVGSLNDPYTVFFDPDETKMFEEDIAGEFSGVGMEIGMKDRILTVIAPLKGTPAYKAGIKSGDKILKINEKVTNDLGVDEAVKMIRGEKGTKVKLSIFSEGDDEPRDLEIVRDVINVPTLDTETKDGVFIVRLYSFSANSPELFRKAIKEFAESGLDKLLLDLRGNPGGYLEASVSMASWFLPQGKVVVVEDYGEGLDPKNYRSDGYDVFSDELKFVILIDGGSASASEILAGALRDHGKAILVGDKSFGKGSVQEVVEITPDTILKITVAKWLTPKGTSISEKGLEPDHKVEMTREDREAERDPQEAKAIEILKNWDQYKK